MIYYDFQQDFTQEQYVDQINLTYGNEALSEATVYNCFKEFHCGRSSLRYEFRKSRSRLINSCSRLKAYRFFKIYGKSIGEYISFHKVSLPRTLN